MKNFYLVIGLSFLISITTLFGQDQSGDHYATMVITSEPVIVVPSIASQIENGTFIPAENLNQIYNPKKWGQNTSIPGKGFPKGGDPLMNLQKDVPKSPGKAPILTFNAASSGSTPTDPTGAVGPDHFVNAWNSSFRIWDKSGNPLTSAASLGTIFPGTLGDPIVMYDRYADRFFISEFFSNGFDVAVSQGPDPVNDGWYVYRYSTSSFPDYPKYSVWSDGYYITANKDQGSPTTSEVVFALERDAMLTGDPTAQLIGFSLPGIVISGFYSPLGFNCNGPTLPPAGNAPIVYMQDDSWSGVSTDHLKIWSINVNWSSPGSSTISSPQTINTTPFDGLFDGGSFSNLPQPSGSDIDALQATIMYMAQYRRFSGYNSVVFNFVVDLDGSDDYAGIRWYELRQNGDGNPWSIYQEGTYVQPDGHSAFCGNMCMDANGNIALAYTTVSTTLFPSLRYSGRLASDPLNTMPIAEEVIGNGTQIDPSFRYGDYAQMTIDPVDDATFWSIGEYFTSGTRVNRVGVFQFAPPGLNAEFTADATNICTGSTVTFTDQSTGSPISYNWTFPGGTPGTASGEGPHTITYDTPGTYNVILEVGDGSTTDTETKTGYITVENVIADFVGTPTTVIVGNSVTFTDNSSCSPNSWTWTFPGGSPNSASGIGPHVITYNTAGTYDVSLQVSNANGSNSVTKTDYINVINCTYCPSTYTNTTDDWITNVTFNTINNSSGQGGSDSYEDYTSISTDVNLGTTYPLTVGIGIFNGTWTQNVWAWIDWNQNCSFDANEAYDLGARNTSGSLSTNITVPVNAIPGPTVMRIIEQFNSDPLPCNNHPTSYGETEDYTVNVLNPNQPPVADFSADDTTPAVGQTVQFTDNSTNTPTSWSWTFSPASVNYVGGTNSGSQNPQVEFTASGYYTVTLVATNSNGSDPETKTNYILAGTSGNWTGFTNTNWNIGSNWETLSVPTSTDDVMIPSSAPNWPVYNGNLTLGTTCGNITMNGASELTVTGDLTISSGTILTNIGSSVIYVAGDWNNDGTFTAGAGTVNMNGTSAGLISVSGSSTGGGKLDNSGGGGYYGYATYVTFNSTSAFTLISAKVYASGSGNRTFYWSNSSGVVQQQVTINVPSGESRVILNFNITPGSNHRLGVSSSSPNLFRNNSGVSYPYPIGSVASIVSSEAGTAYYYFYYDIEYSVGSGAETFYNLEVSKTTNALSTNGDISVLNNLTIRPDSWFTNTSGNTVDVTGDFLLEADPNGMASYIDNGTTTVGSTTYVQQHLTYTPPFQYHLVSAPISDATINTYYDMYLYEYDEPTNDFVNLSLPTTMTMDVGKGYYVTGSDQYIGSTTVTFETTTPLGALNNSDVPVTGFSTSGPDPNFEGFLLVGNPFPCAIDWNSSVDWNRSNLSGWALILDNGAYRGWHPTMGSYNGKTDGIIPSTQGFWVRANSLPATLTIPASQRVHSSQDFYKEGMDNEYATIRLQAGTDVEADETVIVFHPEGHAEFDGYYDLSKFTNPDGVPQLYTQSGEMKYAFNVLPEEYAEMIIPVYFEINTAGEYQLTAIEIENIADEMNVYLEDLKEGTVTELKSNPEYEFSYDPLDDAHRFNLHFKDSWYGIEYMAYAGIRIYSHADRIYIQTPEQEQGEIIVYDLMGHEKLRTVAEPSGQTIITMAEPSGYYLVRVHSGSKVKTEKVFLK